MRTDCDIFFSWFTNCQSLHGPVIRALNVKLRDFRFESPLGPEIFPDRLVELCYYRLHEPWMS